MGALKGKREFKKWKDKKRLTRKEAILATCYICNGYEEGGVDCKGKDNCPLYQYFPY